MQGEIKKFYLPAVIYPPFIIAKPPFLAKIYTREKGKFFRSHAVSRGPIKFRKQIKRVSVALLTDTLTIKTTESLFIEYFPIFKGIIDVFAVGLVPFFRQKRVGFVFGKKSA